MGQPPRSPRLTGGREYNRPTPLGSPLHTTTTSSTEYFSELANHMGIGVPHDPLAPPPTCECARAAAGMVFEKEEVRWTGMTLPSATSVCSPVLKAGAAGPAVVEGDAPMS